MACAPNSVYFYLFIFKGDKWSDFALISLYVTHFIIYNILWKHLTSSQSGLLIHFKPPYGWLKKQPLLSDFHKLLIAFPALITEMCFSKGLLTSVSLLQVSSTHAHTHYFNVCNCKCVIYCSPSVKLISACFFLM